MFQKPNQKSATAIALMGAGAVAGAKLSDGIVSVFPEDTSSGVKRGVVAALGFALAVCVNPATTGGKVVQGAGLGMFAKQADAVLTEKIKPSIEKRMGGTATDKFLNAVVGYSEVETPMPSEFAERQMLNAAWESAEPYVEADALWNRPESMNTPRISMV